MAIAVPIIDLSDRWVKILERLNKIKLHPFARKVNATEVIHWKDSKNKTFAVLKANEVDQ